MEDDSRVLVPELFEFVLNQELKRSVRSRAFLTLLILEPSLPDVPGGGAGERERLVRHVARLVGHDVRETDLVAQTGKDRVSIALLDANLQNSMSVVERLIARFEHYDVPRPTDVRVSAACCPSDGVSAESLRRAAESRPVHRRRDAGG